MHLFGFTCNIMLHGFHALAQPAVVAGDSAAMWVSIRQHNLCYKVPDTPVEMCKLAVHDAAAVCGKQTTYSVSIMS